MISETLPLTNAGSERVRFGDTTDTPFWVWLPVAKWRRLGMPSEVVVTIDAVTPSE